MPITFSALVKEVRSKSLVSGDKSVRVLLETEDLKALEAAALPSDGVVQITISE